MTHTEYEEELAVRIISDHLNLQTRNNRSLTKIKEDPPDYDFEIGDHKIGCEVVHFHLINQPATEKGKNLANEGAIRRNIVKGIQRSLQEKGIPPLAFSFNFITQPSEVPINVEKIVNIITIMHKKSVTQSQIYERNNPEEHYRLFDETNISSIEILYLTSLNPENTDERYPYIYNYPGGPTEAIKAEDMQAVITSKDRDIPKYKEHYDQKWLIITNYETIGYFTLNGAAKETQFKCNFDKVLYIQMSWIEPNTRKQKREGSLTDTYTVYELKTKPQKHTTDS